MYSAPSRCARSLSQKILISRTTCSNLLVSASSRIRIRNIEPSIRALSASSRPAPADPQNTTSRYAVVDHSLAYEQSMRGRHGKQLALAALEGIGKDDPPFDPFLEEELEEERLRQAASVDEGEVLGEEEGVEEEGGIDDEEDEGDSEDDDDDDADEGALQSLLYNNDGSLRRTKSELATLRAGAPAGGVFAVIELAGSQHKVTTDDVLIVNRLKPLDTFQVGSIHSLQNVMLLSSSHLTLVGMPYVTGAEVVVMVEEITMDAKVIVFKKRRRKNSKRKTGFRRDVTMLRVLDIRPPAEQANHRHVERASPST